MKLKQALINAYENGYRVINGIVYNPIGVKLFGVPDSKGYMMFSPKKYDKVFIHRLVAYQKYGNMIFENGIQVRHLDGNKKNNLDNNITIGNQSQNMMDISVELRIKKSINAATKRRRFTDEEIIQIKKDYELFQSYDKTMNKWNISSKGTLYYILHNKYKTKWKSKPIGGGR